MTNLRQGRWLQVFLDACSAKSSVATAALAGAMLLPGLASAAAPTSHSRRPLPTPLHASHVTETGSRATVKKRKGGLKNRTGAESAGSAGKHGSAAHGGGKRGSKGRGRRTDPVDDPVPMFRAEGRHGTHGAPATAWNARHGSLRYGPAPLVSSWHHGHALPATSHGHGGRERGGDTEMPVMRASGFSRVPAPIERRSPATANRAHYASPTVDSAGSGTASGVRAEAYAEGVSRPEDDERLPRAHGGSPGSEAGNGLDLNNAPVASASAAPSRVTAGPLRQPAVVQGFGAEVAVPSAAGSSSATDRPGGTRRRNHPSNWDPQPTALSAEPLEEREAITEAAVGPAVLPELYDRNGRLVMRAPLKGSHDVLVHQNVMADNDGLERIQTDADLERLRAAHLLVALPASESLHVNEDLPANRRVARPWTAMFAADIGRAFYTRFHEPIYLTSAVRTVNYQAHLQLVNGNAAGLWGDTASPHLTGQAVDLAKRGMSSAELAWMRGYLLPLMQAGKIDVEEEFHQACFHVSVYRSYAAGRRVLQHEVAQVHPAPQAVPAGTDAGSADSPEDR